MKLKLILFFCMTSLVQLTSAAIINTLSSEDGNVTLTETIFNELGGDYGVENNSSEDIYYLVIGYDVDFTPDATSAFTGWAHTLADIGDGLPTSMNNNTITSLNWIGTWEDYFPESAMIVAYHTTDSAASYEVVASGTTKDGFEFYFSPANYDATEIATDFVVFGSSGSVIAQSQSLATPTPGTLALLLVGLLFSIRRHKSR